MVVDCIHRGAVVASTQVIRCGCGCQWSSVLACDIHGLCCPFYESRDETIHFCSTCEECEPVRESPIAKSRKGLEAIRGAEQDENPKGPEPPAKTRKLFGG